MYSIDYAPTDRATCPKCKKKIAKGSLRIGKTMPSTFSYDSDEMTKFYHPAHLFQAQRQTKRPWSVPLENEDQLKGLSKLHPQDRQRIHKLLKPKVTRKTQRYLIIEDADSSSSDDFDSSEFSNSSDCDDEIL